MGTPRCWLDDDGVHFWFQHECTPRDVSHLDAETAKAVLELEAEPSMLPLGPTGWTVEQTDPLTISPSIQCGRCGVHGFFRAGVWVPA